MYSFSFFFPNLALFNTCCSVYAQRQTSSGTASWIYGTPRTPQSYLYALAGKVSDDDTNFDVYPLRRACIPHSYMAADNETQTSGQNNDIVVFHTPPFRGPSNAIATLADSFVYDERRYMLMQYPADVEKGTAMVIDQGVESILEREFMGGTFYSIGLASWSGSSGGPIVDIEETLKQGRMVITGVLMSSGWKVCDSGIALVAGDYKSQVEMLAESVRQAGRSADAGDTQNQVAEEGDADRDIGDDHDEEEVEEEEQGTEEKDIVIEQVEDDQNAHTDDNTQIEVNDSASGTAGASSGSVIVVTSARRKGGTDKGSGDDEQTNQSQNQTVPY